jgi:cation diffusion facilitator CzcD-associated flavoprotein CzcO
MVATSRVGPSRRRIAIIGAGPGGICTGIRLLEAGYDDFVILEQAPAVGGTWFHNRYPGAECDVMSHLYSFSFEPNPDWSRRYSPQPEIRAYLERCVEKYGLDSHLRLGTTVRALHWDEAHDVWRVRVEPGDDLEVDVVVSALGMFNEPVWPDIPGLESFTGARFHSSRWEDGHDLSGERVAVIGSAASAVQLVPEVARDVAQLFVFQRTPTWVLPKDDRPYTDEDRARFHDDPDAMPTLRQEIADRVNGGMTFADPEALRIAEEAGLANIAAVDDPEVRHKLTPTLPFGTRRPLVSNVYYPTFNRDNVELVTEAIERITPNAIVTVDGVERAVDTIVLATGFATTKYLGALDVIGRAGCRLADAWAADPQAYLGITTAGFPNVFMLYGPNTNNGSIISMIEDQVDYIVRHLRWMDDEHLAWIDVRHDVVARYNQALQRDLDGVEVWQAERDGYYRGPSGRIVTQWPHTMTEYRTRLERPDEEAFDVKPQAPVEPSGDGHQVIKSLG